MMLAVINAKQRLMGNPRLLGKFSIGKNSPFFSQEFCQLPVEIASHTAESGKNIVTYVL